MGMANLRAGPTAGDDMATGVSGLFRTRYPEMVRLADLLGADDPEDIAQEAFARLLRKYDSLRDPDSASSRSARSTPPRHSRAAAGSWCSVIRLTCWSRPRAR